MTSACEQGRSEAVGGLFQRVEHRMLESFSIAKSPTKAYVSLQLRLQMGSEATHTHTHKHIHKNTLQETDFR